MSLEGKIKLKVCGMTDPENILDVVSTIQPDFMGLIFYPKSKRFVSEQHKIPALINTKVVGVFVNEDTSTIADCIDKYGLDFVQLHGDETTDQIEELLETGVGIIKVIRVGKKLDLSQLDKYSRLVDYFLFDTDGKEYGGTGKTFDWSLLENYSFHVPYFLSGGLSLEVLSELDLKKMPGLVGIDVNSGFELEPGIKDIKKLSKIYSDELSG